MSIATRITAMEQHIENAYKKLEDLGINLYILPEGYTQLDYIGSTGTQYIDVGITPKSTHKYEVGFKVLAQRTNDAIFGSRSTGTYNTSTDQVYLTTTNSTGLDTTQYTDGRVGTTRNSMVAITINQKADVSIDMINRTFAVNGTSNSFTTDFDNNATQNIFLLGFNSLGNPTSILNGHIYYFKVYENNVLVRNMIPCYRNSDNEVGLYDLVNGVFYDNDGTGTFTAGEISRETIDKNIDNIATVLEEYYNEQPKVTATDVTEATLNGTKVGKLKLDLKGHSEQETTEGYNLYYMDYDDYIRNFAGINIKSTKTGYSASGTCTDSTAFTLTFRTITLPAGIYTFKPQKPSAFRLGISKTDYSSIIRLAVGEAKGTFTLNEETEICLTLAITKDQTYNEENEIMIYSGTEDKPFEQYTFGASPNPSHEQPIKSCGENIQLLNLNDITSTPTITNNGDGSITLNGNVPQSNFSLSQPITLRANKPYTLSLEPLLIGDIRSSTFILRKGNTNILSCRYDTGTITVTPTEDTTIDTIRFYNGGIIFDNYTFKPKLEPGSIATPYSPYGMGSIPEKIVNKNLFDGEIELGSLSTSTGNTVSSNNCVRTKNYQIVKPSTNYHLSNDKNYQSVVMLYDKNKNFLSSLGSKQQFTTTADTKYIKWRSSEVNVENDITVKYQLELGLTETPYVPHEEQTYTIPTQQPFRSIGDVRDVFFKNTVDSPYYDENLILNGWYERHDIKRLIFDGTENWQFDSSRYRFFILLSESQLSTNRSGKSNYFKIGNTETTNNCFSFSATAVLFRVDETITSKEDAKSWVATKYANGRPLYVDYLLQDPTNLLCTTEQTNILENLPKSYAGQTNIYSIDEIKAYMDVAALKGE